jgi:hypothetical protein
MARRPDPEDKPFTQAELKEVHRNLSMLSRPSVVDFYRSAHKACAVERKPGAKTMQQLVTAWKLLRRWR